MKSNSNTLAQNRKAGFNYFLKEDYEAGIVLTGSEIKSLRDGRANIQDAFVDKDAEGNLYLVNAFIQEYKGIAKFNHKPNQKRRLLLHKNEIKRIIGKIQIKGLTVVPLSMYLNSRNLVKVKIAVAEGKKLYDKRATIKEREWNRTKRRIMSESKS